MLNSIFDILFPPSCLACKKHGEFVCENCFKNLETNTRQFCPICQNESMYGMTCDTCVNKTYLDGLIVSAPYHQKFDLLKKIIQKCKYKYNKNLIKYLSRLMIDRIEELPFIQNTVIVPVPLHFRRIFQRGFNQSEYLAYEIQKTCNLPVYNILKRVRNTKQQALLSRKDRLKNLKNAFSLRKKYLKKSINSNFLIIDDVATTLSTMNECAKVLKENGVYGKVFGIVVARG